MSSGVCKRGWCALEKTPEVYTTSHLPFSRKSNLNSSQTSMQSAVSGSWGDSYKGKLNVGIATAGDLDTRGIFQVL